MYRQIELSILQNSGLGGFGNATVVSDNWDDINATGLYSAASQNQPELPVAVGGLFVLSISSGLYISQLCMRSNSSTPRLWRRSKDTNGWGAWVSVLLTGDFGVGASPSIGPAQYSNADTVTSSGFSASGGASATGFFNNYAPLMTMVRSGGNDNTGMVSQLQISPSAIGFRARELNTWTSWRTIYHNGNTTKASDGSIKAASPVARIASPEASIRPDVDEYSFEWCGYGVANDEARGIQITREDVGVYKLTGAKSLASSGWRLEPPKDPDGSGDLGVVRAEQVDDEIIISLFRLKMVLANGEIVIQPGEPIDVPAHSWIDVRLDMPEPIIPPDAQVEEPQPQPE